MRFGRFMRSLWPGRQPAREPAAAKEGFQWNFVDRPIASSKDDELERLPFAQAIAKSLLSWGGNDSLVVAISGEWGSGKTSLKNMILECIRQQQPVTLDIVQFNPWEWSTQHRVAEQFYAQIGSALRLADPSKGRSIAKQWERYSVALEAGSHISGSISESVTTIIAVLAPLGLVTYLTSPSPTSFGVAIVATALTVVSALLKALGTIAHRIGQFWSALFDGAAHPSLEERKQQISANLRTFSRNFLVVIDDIDRLTSEETFVLFQHIKANADFPRLVYLLLFDASLVSKSLARAAGASGKAFLEKIVQVAFDIPALNQDQIDQILLRHLDSIISPLNDSHWDDVRWGNAYFDGLQGFFTNLREVKRFLSTLTFHVGLFSGPVLEINLVDLVSIEALRVFEPELYRAMMSAKYLLTSRLGDDRDRLKPLVDSLINHSELHRRPIVTKVLERLFPTVEYALGGLQTTGAEFEREWREQLRVCSRDFFDRYFQLGVRTNDVSESELRALIEISNDKNRFKEKVKEILARNVHLALFTKLADAAPTIDIENALTFLPAMFEIGDEVPKQLNTFSIDLLWALWRILARFLAQADIETRGALLWQTIDRTDALVTPGEFIAQLANDAGRQQGAQNSFSLSTQDLTLASAIWLNKVTTVARTTPERLSGLARLMSLLGAWKDLWGDSRPAAEWVSDAIQTQEGLLSYIQAATQEVTTTTLGDVAGRKRLVVQVPALKMFADVGVLKQRAQEVQRVDLDKSARALLNAFKVAVDL